MKEKELKETIFDQSLDLIRSYQAVDLEITLLEARDTYTPEEVARQRKENLKFAFFKRESSSQEEGKPIAKYFIIF